MKILFVVSGGNDLGGIITSTEQYIKGLQEAGHETDFATVGFSKSPTRRDRPPRGKFANDFTIGEGTGVLMHPTQGWRGELRFSLMNEPDRAAFIQLAKKYDIIIWASIYGFRNPDTEGRSEWFDAIRKLKGKHVFFVHDDHLPTRYPWAYALAPYARAFIGVQPCSYDSLEGVAAPRAMVYTPLPPLPRSVAPLDGRSGFFMCQVWKGWKNGDRLLAAAPHMRTGSKIAFAGDGIQLRYIRSPDKCPPRFRGLWTSAMGRHEYLGVLQEADRDAYLKHKKFLVDLSLRGQGGSGQYNRIAQEAMAQGCVVIADKRFITGTGPDPVFVDDVHYIHIDSQLPPKELAKELMNIEKDTDAKAYAGFQKRARQALAVFDRKALGMRIEIVTNPRCSWSDKRPDKAKLKLGRDEFAKVFGDRP